MVENNFDGLLAATKTLVPCETIIQGYEVKLIPSSTYDGQPLFFLSIGGCESNICQTSAMRKLLKEWKNGNRQIMPAYWSSPKAGLLIKKY